jgi:hypothetical protein
MPSDDRRSRFFLLGDAGNDYLTATGGFMHFNGGPENNQMVAAAGHSNNRYIFAPGSGQDSITGFEAETAMSSGTRGGLS